MNRTIKTYNDMCEEREKLKNLLVLQKQRVMDDWRGVKDELSPVNHMFGAIGKMAKGDKSNPIVNMSLKLVGDLFLKHFVLAKAGWVTRMTVPFVVKNYSSHVLADKGKILLAKLGKLFSRKQTQSYASE